MTVIPLIVALMVTAVAKGADAARTGRVAGKSIAWFAALYIASAVLGAIVTPLLLELFPLPAATGQSLKAGIAAIDPTQTATPIPGIRGFLPVADPRNVFAAAAAGEILPLVIFTAAVRSGAVAGERGQPGARPAAFSKGWRKRC